ncbi:MAG: hypothetical protein KDK36_19115 [Leptospiraceae bacterium]|nr:hypothetical protein [Leptospiraceae bacterium]
MKLNLLVIKSKNIHDLKDQYEMLGIKFEYHKHGEGPMHYSSIIDGIVFEIYPIKVDFIEIQGKLRLGFEVENLDLLIKNIERTTWRIIKGKYKSDYGNIAIIEDLDNNKIELKERS